MDQDILYHLALGSGSHDLQEMFGDVKVHKLISKMSPEIIENYFSFSLYAWAVLQSGWRILHTL